MATKSKKAAKRGKSTKTEKGKGPKKRKAKPSKKASSTKAVKGTKPKPTKATRRNTQEGKRLSALDTAVQVLAKAGKPMRAKELIAAMAEQNLWTSPVGKTPHATLYSAMIREIGVKGKEARFKKVDRGQFAFNG